jgi:hypothetical protein
MGRSQPTSTAKRNWILFSPKFPRFNHFFSVDVGQNIWKNLYFTRFLHFSLTTQDIKVK